MNPGSIRPARLGGWHAEPPTKPAASSSRRPFRCCSSAGRPRVFSTSGCRRCCRSVGLTTGAAYRIWADQTEFHRDLAVEMVGLRFAPPVASAASAIQRGARVGRLAARMSLAPRHWTHVTYASKFHTRARVARLARLHHRARTPHGGGLLAGTEGGQRRAPPRVDRRRSRSSTGALLQQYGRRVRSPLRRSATSPRRWQPSVRGSRCGQPRVSTTPPTTSPRAGSFPAGEWTLFGIGIQGLVAAFSDPVSSDRWSPAARQSRRRPGSLIPHQEGRSRPDGPESDCSVRPQSIVVVQHLEA